MGKSGGFLTPKAIGNRIKAKGLQKLRWYCQMCQKQCRDANGFKCHQTSESHLRQMRIFRDDPHKFMKQYSREFERAFMEVLRRRGRSRVKANTVYQELVADRQHTHMNSTSWSTLSNFVQYLGREGKAKVDQTEKGWYIEYIDKDPEKMRRQEAMRAHERAELDAEERAQLALKKQIKQAHANAEMLKSEQEEDEEAKAFKRPEASGQKIQVKLTGLSSKLSRTPTLSTWAPAAADAEAEAEADAEMEVKDDADKGAGETEKGDETGAGAGAETRPATESETNNATATAAGSETTTQKAPSAPSMGMVFNVNGPSSSSGGLKRKVSALERIKQETEMQKNRLKQRKMEEEFEAEEKRRGYSPWICVGVVVKVMNKDLADGLYFKQKGDIIKVENRYLATVKMLKTAHILQIDQSQLETVIPNIGRSVKIVRGQGSLRGEQSTLLELNKEDLSVDLKIETGPRATETVRGVSVDDVCKISK